MSFTVVSIFTTQGQWLTADSFLRSKTPRPARRPWTRSMGWWQILEIGRTRSHWRRSWHCLGTKTWSGGVLLGSDPATPIRIVFGRNNHSFKPRSSPLNMLSAAHSKRRTLIDTLFACHISSQYFSLRFDKFDSKSCIDQSILSVSKNVCCSSNDTK